MYVCPYRKYYGGNSMVVIVSDAIQCNFPTRY